VLKAAAQKGYRAVGYEINPLLVLISRWRLRKYKKSTQIYFGDFYYTKLPSDTKAIYVFSAGAFLKSLQKYLHKEVKRLDRPITLISYGYELPAEEIKSRQGASVLYRLQP
jgi:hypothetical protein